VNLAERIRVKDPTLWGPADTPELANRLGWVDLPATMEPRLEELAEIRDRIVAAGTDDVIVLGMGGSSLAPEVFARTFGIAPDHPRLRILDSTHPEQIARVAESIDPQRTTFLVASKSGTTLETLSGFRFFWQATRGDGERFVSITDPDTPLQGLAKERDFLATVTAPPDVGGRFSALTPFGLLPAALIGVDLGRLLEAGAAVDWSEAVALGEEWAANAQAGRDKLTCLTSPGISAFPVWLEQLVAESLGKDGKGIVPVASEPGLDRYGDDRLFVQYRLEGQPVAAIPPGRPAIRRDLSDRYALATEMMASEIAVASAGIGLGVHPFNQPDVELAKERARQALGAESARVDIVEIFSPTLADQIEALLMTLAPADYFALQAFLPADSETDSILAAIRHRVGNRTGNATTAGYGPRFLHSTGQLHKGGPNTGVFVQLLDSPITDLAIPEMDDSFGRVIAAQALGDYQALRERGRRVMRIDLGPNRRKGLQTLLDSIG
jgi:transaldolase / glucose-6-phosphate isomerase